MSRSPATTGDALPLGSEAKPVVAIFVALSASIALIVHAAPALADQPRDFMLDFQPEGTFLLVDYFGTGGQLTLEDRRDFYGNANTLTLAAGVVPAYPQADAFARADLRILFLSIGGLVAYRSVWHDLVFEPGANSYCLRCDRRSRRAQDSLVGDTTGSERFPYGEARASLFFPFNEHLVMESTGALRYEGRKDRSFDWFYTSIYDRGVLGRWETVLFVKDHRFGGIGPYLQLLDLPRGSRHDAQWAFGFNAVMRLGLLARNDLLFLTFLTRPGDPSYGQHNYFSPIRALLIYRMILEL
jgi:hypothetical protein